MNGKIASSGVLFIERAGTLTEQACPFSSMSPSAFCGDNCPLFGEPQPHDNGNQTRIEICQGRILSFKKLIDERIAKK